MIIDAAELKRRRLQRLKGVRNNKVYIGPEVVTLDTTSSCNLRCRFCATNHMPGNSRHFDEPSFISWDNFIGVVNDCVDLKVDQIDFGGPGEPTMHPLFGEVISHLEQQPLWVRLVTNATFPPALCSDVIKADQVVINLSAVDRQQYRDIHGKDLFDRVVCNIKRLVSLRDACNPGVHIEISYVVNAINVLQMEKIQELASGLGVHGVMFRKMNVRPYNWQIALQDGACQVPGEEKRTPPACLNGWFYLMVRLDGKTSYCYRIHQTQAGDINKVSLKKIWLSRQMMNMRLLGKYGYLQKKIKECQLCPFYDKNVQCLQAAKEEFSDH